MEALVSLLIRSMGIPKEFEQGELSNGMQIVHRSIPYSRVVHIGFILDIGSRDEYQDESGIAHFWEHMAFKGTEKRKYYHIIQSLESVGGELNAYTTKEKICFYASVLTEYLDRAIDLLTDITFHSTFPEKEIEKERGVILEEMSMYLDSPEDAIHDEFDELVFPNHTLGTNILGRKESVERFTRESFFTFFNRNAHPGRIIFSSVGNVPFHRIQKSLERKLEGVNISSGQHKRAPFTGYRPHQRIKKREGLLAHAVLGREAPEISHKDRLSYFMLVNLLAGSGMNSRLNMALREKNGLVYAVESNYTPYIDTGCLSIYFACEPSNLDRCIQLTMKEIKRLSEKPLGGLQLHNAQKQLKGQLAMAEENHSNFMLIMGKSILDTGTIESLETIFHEIDALSPDTLFGIAQRYLNPSDFSTLIYKP